MKYIPVIVILFLILVILLAIYVGVRKIQRKAREFSREVFGTDDLRKAAGEMRMEMASVPKSVSAMTSLLLPQIVRDFPDFEYNEMKERADISVFAGMLSLCYGCQRNIGGRLKRR